MYEKVRNAYSLFAQIEADTAKFVSAEFEDLAEQAYLVKDHHQYHYTWHAQSRYLTLCII